MTYLATNTNAEDIWKMLAYNDYNALSKPTLTFSQKMDLVWTDNQPQENYGVFLTNLVEDMVTESKCIMKIYMEYIHASDLFSSVVVYAFDFLYGGKMSIVNYNGIPVSRGDLFVNKILTVLNGVEIGGIGKFTFSENMSRYDYSRSVIGNSKTFTGVQLFLSTVMGDKGILSGCDT